MSLRRWRPRRVNTLFVGFACMLALITAMGLQLRPFTYLWVSLYTGIAVAILSISLTSRLEKSYQQEHQATLAPKQDLQRLSARLVAGQKQDRHPLSPYPHHPVRPPFPILQEAVTNCARLSGARSVVVKLASEAGRHSVCIVDDGKGLVPTHEGCGIGLMGIEERVAEMKGDFQLSSLPGTGTKLYISIPLDGIGAIDGGEAGEALAQPT